MVTCSCSASCYKYLTTSEIHRLMHISLDTNCREERQASGMMLSRVEEIYPLEMQSRIQKCNKEFAYESFVRPPVSNIKQSFCKRGDHPLLCKLLLAASLALASNAESERLFSEALHNSSPAPSIFTTGPAGPAASIESGS